MILVGQAVPDRNACIFRQILHDLLTESAVLDPVKHPAQHPCSVLDALLLADLGTCRSKISRAHSHVVSRHLECTAGPCAVLLEDQRNILSLIMVHRHAVFLLLLHVRRQVDQISDLLRCEILQCQKIPSF